MGNPTLRLGATVVVVNGFFFNVAMTVFREAFEKSAVTVPGPVVERITAHIVEKGYEDVMDTGFYFDAFVADGKDRRDLQEYLRHLITLVMSPGFTLPEPWRRLLAGEVSKLSTPIPITHEHFVGIAYVYQTMFDLVEDRIRGNYVQRHTPPAGWEPKR